jgi:hypothetical protein
MTASKEDVVATARFLILDAISSTWGQGADRLVDTTLDRLRSLVPELPPGFEITFSDDNADPKYNGWDIWIRGGLYDGREGEDPNPQDRAVAVEECWSMWLGECGPEWRAFIEALRG